MNFMYFQLLGDVIQAAVGFIIPDSMSADELVYIRWKGYSIQTVPSRETVLTTKFTEEDYNIQSQHRKINRYLEVRESK